MDMKNFVKITDDLNEKISIGKKIYETRTDIYNDYMTDYIRDRIDSDFKIISQRNAENGSGGGTDLLFGGMNKEELFYHSIYDYWVYGSTIEEEIYYSFYEKSHAEKNKFLTLRNRMMYLDYLNDTEAADRLENKYEAYCALKEYYLRDIIRIEKDDDYDKFRDFVAKHREFVVKPEEFGLAMGVHKVALSNDCNLEEEFKKILNEKNIDASEYHPMIRKRESGKLVLEELIEQEDTMASLHPASINCLRCNTFRVGDKVHLFYPWIKIGKNNNFIASAQAGSVMAGIDAKTGIINTDGYDEHLGEYVCHPSTGVKLKGFQIPKWDELLSMIDKIGHAVPEVRFVGWDIALSKKGWCVIEANTYGEFVWQIVLQRGTKHELEDLIGWKPEKFFWWE